MNGLIAFFDILGYQSFLENNSATESAEKVLKLITEIPKQAKSDVSQVILNLNDKKPDEITKEITDALKYLIFSDTIFISIEYPANLSVDWKRKAIVYLSAVSGALYAAMFREGLPLRGAIVEGDFIVKDFCFAGKAIVKAYKICEKLNFSGIVFDDGVMSPVSESFNNSTVLPTLVNYLSQLNEVGEQKMLHINWLCFLSENEIKILKSDIETFVHRSFWAHNKDCPQVVDAKIANTIKLVRRLAIALEDKK